MPNRRKLVDLAGRRFGRLVAMTPVIEYRRETSWACLCDCGGNKVVSAALLLCGRVSSCGCARVKHGLCFVPEYKIWTSMNQRCSLATHKPFPRYGGRGITVCELWRFDFARFYGDVGPRPSSSHSLDRIENDGNYEPGNVRWATPAEQANNRAPAPGRQCRTLDDQPITRRAIAHHLAMTYGAYMYAIGHRA